MKWSMILRCALAMIAVTAVAILVFLLVYRRINNRSSVGRICLPDVTYALHLHSAILRGSYMEAIASAAMKAGLAAAGVVILSIRMKRSNRPLSWFGVTAPPLVPT